jgi:Putative MetA-pathway of phenol degradation
MRTAVLMILLCGCATLAHAAHPLVTEDTGTQGQGRHQVEINTDWLRMEGSRARIGSFTYTYGASDPLDVFVTTPVTMSAPAGINDISVGAKWRLLEAGPVSFALKPEFFLPTGNEFKGLGNGYPGLALTFAGSVDSGPWQWHGNVAVTLNRYRMAADRATYRNAIWRASSAVSYAAGEKWRLLADVGIAREQDSSRDNGPVHLLAGVIYTPLPNFDLDAGIRFNRNCGRCSLSGDRQFGAGLTWRF